MPRKPLRACSVPGCPGIAIVGSYCPNHSVTARREYVDDRPSASRRGYDRKWRRIRAQFLTAHPICADCGREATEPHHVVPRAEGGSDRWDNLVPLCGDCHKRREAARRAGRG